MTLVNLLHLTKTFSNQCTAVDDMTLEIPDGRITALLGPSGCGKTTTLKMIAGLLSPTEGEICFDGCSVLSEPPEKRKAAMVFQNHLLFPYMTINENIGFGLKMRGERPAQIREKVGQILERVHLSGLGESKPGRLSGGQQQRAALARALVIQPRVLLLDEPLSNLDAHLKEEMREVISSVQHEEGITTIFVTHDQEEAVILADQIALMFQGVIQQVGQPSVFYEQPASTDVARFFGARNFIPGIAQGAAVQTGLGNISTQQNIPGRKSVILTIRPENIQVAEDAQDGENLFAGQVTSCVYLGTGARLSVEAGETMIEIHAKAELAGRYRAGDWLRFHLPADRLWTLDN